MARGDFLSGLSSGIFERLGGIRQEQEAKDQQSKAQVIQMLAGLADKIEPESLPLLMGHMWDTMGIKKQASGKGLRGFLDAFGGTPNRSIEDQLGTKFRELTQGMVGPEQAKDIRLKANLSQKGIPGIMQAAPNSAYGQQAQQDLQGLKGKMVFRDPYQQRLEEIQSRYGAQLQNQQAMQEERLQASLKRQNEEHEFRRQRDVDEYNRKVSFGVNKLAMTYMNDPDIVALPKDQQVKAARQKAQTFLSDESTDKAEYLKQGIESRKAFVNKTNREALGGGSPSVQLSREKFGYAKTKDRSKMEKDISGAQAEYDTFNPRVTEMEKDLDNEAKRYGTTRQQLLEGESVLSGAGPIAKKIKTYRDTIEARNKAEANLKTMKEELSKFDLQQGGGKKVATPPPKATKGGITPTPREGGMPGNWIKAPAAQIEGRGHKVGDTIQMGKGGSYIVGEKKGDWYVLKPVQ
jgi:hypothetical protein